MNEWINGWMNNLKSKKNIYYLSPESKVIIVSKRVRSCIDISTHPSPRSEISLWWPNGRDNWSYLL